MPLVFWVLGIPLIAEACACRPAFAAACSAREGLAAEPACSPQAVALAAAHSAEALVDGALPRSAVVAQARYAAAEDDSSPVAVELVLCDLTEAQHSVAPLTDAHYAAAPTEDSSPDGTVRADLVRNDSAAAMAACHYASAARADDYSQAGWEPVDSAEADSSDSAGCSRAGSVLVGRAAVGYWDSAERARADCCSVAPKVDDRCAQEVQTGDSLQAADDCWVDSVQDGCSKLADFQAAHVLQVDSFPDARSRLVDSPREDCQGDFLRRAMALAWPAEQ